MLVSIEALLPFPRDKCLDEMFRWKLYVRLQVEQIIQTPAYNFLGDSVILFLFWYCLALPYLALLCYVSLPQTISSQVSSPQSLRPSRYGFTRSQYILNSRRLAHSNFPAFSDGWAGLCVRMPSFCLGVLARRLRRSSADPVTSPRSLPTKKKRDCTGSFKEANLGFEEA